MAHDIFGDRFAAVRVPAWHKVGKVYEEAVTPSFAAEDTDLLYMVNTYPLFAQSENELIKTGLVMVGRMEGTELVNFGTSSEFDLTMLEDVLPDLDDLSTRYPLSACGALAKGALAFFTFTISEETEIAGEAYSEYLTVLHSYKPGTSHKMLYSPVRTVCANTLVMAEEAATSKVAVSHTAGSKKRLDAAYIVSDAIARASAIKKQLEKLTTVSLTDDAAATVIKKTYARYAPTKALDPFVADLVEDSVMTTLYTKKVSQEKYAANLALLATEAYTTINAEYPEHAGTAYNLYQAIVEAADWRRGKSSQGNAESALVGVRAAEKKTAFELLMAMA